MWCVKLFTFALILQGCVTDSNSKYGTNYGSGQSANTGNHHGSSHTTAHGTTYGSYHGSYHNSNQDYDDEPAYIPNFVTIGQKYSIAVGTTVVLPCKLNLTYFNDEFPLAWKKDDIVISAGTMKAILNSRITLIPSEKVEGTDKVVDSYNLEIRDVKIKDTGNYICQLGTQKRREIVHNLVVLVPPTIIDVIPGKTLEAHKGEKVQLECRSSGHPTPTVTWTRQNNIMPNGLTFNKEGLLVIPSADKSIVGLYRCTADNKVGQPAYREINVNVIYPPEIEVERKVIHTGVGFEVQLVCMIYASPEASILWFHETEQLATTERHTQKNHGSRYVLNIRNLTFYDLGNYTCQAANKLGKERRSMILTGTPAVSVFDSPTLGNGKDVYNISWATVSFSIIQEYRLFYRLQYTTRTTEDEKDELQNPYQHHSRPKSAHYVRQQHRSRSDHWENVVMVERGHDRNNPSNHHGGHHHFVSGELNPRHHMSFTLRNLTPASNYEAKVQARNEFGWNEVSAAFHFSTRAEDVDVELSAQPAISKNADHNASRASHATPFFTFFAIVFYFVSILIDNLL